MSLYCSKCGTGNYDTDVTCKECNHTLQNTFMQGPLEPSALLENRYEIISLIKTGGMGAVYKARDKKLNNICVVKELLAFHSNKEELQQAEKWFNREAELLAKLDHPNLPKVFDYFINNKRYYLVMNFIEGDDLSTLLGKENKGNITEECVIQWIKQILNVLDYLHKQEPAIIYRDIKPANIMLHKDGRAMLIDFGIARSIQPDSMTQKTAIGTPGYSPEEQCYGEAEPRSDIYALGATAYHLLTGIKPEPFKFTFTPIRQIVPNISPELESIIMKALKKNAKQRFSTAEEMLNALNEIENTSKEVKRKKIQINSKIIFMTIGIIIFAISIFMGYKYSALFSSEEKSTWKTEESGTAESLVSIYFKDRNNGWIAGSEGTLIKISYSIWGKPLFTREQTGMAVRLEDICFPDENNGWIVGMNGTIIYTKNGGKEWHPQNSRTSLWLTSVNFIDDKNGWISGKEGALLHTEDGGNNWKVKQMNKNMTFNKILFTDIKNGWITGTEEKNKIFRGIILHTEDGGQNWERMYNKDNTNIFGIHSSDKGTLLACGAFMSKTTMNGMIIATIDKGKTWDEKIIKNTFLLEDIYFTDSKKCVASGMEMNDDDIRGGIFYSNDEGKTWMRENTGTNNILQKIYFFDSENGWAVGEKGTILRYSR